MLELYYVASVYDYVTMMSVLNRNSVIYETLDDILFSNVI